MLKVGVEYITNTRNSSSIMSSPSAFCRAVEAYAMQSPVFGGTVAGERHRKRWYKKARVETDEEPVAIKGGFIQQAVIFSCMGTVSSSRSTYMNLGSPKYRFTTSKAAFFAFPAFEQGPGL